MDPLADPEARPVLETSETPHVPLRADMRNKPKERAGPLRLVGYLRVSGPAQVREGMGLETQERLIRKWAKSNGYKIVAVHSDEGVSGAKNAKDRVGALACLDAVTTDQRGHRSADGIVALNMSRYARELHIQEAFLDAAWRRDARVYTVDEGEERPDDDSDPYRRFVRQVRGSAIELEKNLIVHRLRLGRETGQKKGLRSQGGMSPYGYRSEKGVLEPIKSEQDIIQRMRRMRTQGLGYQVIAARLNEAALLPRRGRWHPTMVMRVLSRPKRRGAG